MWSRSLQRFGFGLCALLIGVAALAQASRQPTDVPLPAAASDALRDVILSRPPRRADELPAPPDTAAEWRRLIAAVDAPNLAEVDAYLADLPVTARPVTLNGVDAWQVTPDETPPEFAGKVMMDLHGGAYVFFAGKGSLDESLVLASRVGIPVVSVDYRMPPDHPFPAALDDAVLAYLALLEDYDASDIAMGGTSAGGGLTLATVHRLKSLGYPLPGVLYLGTPWADLTKTGDTQFTNENLDRVLVTYDNTLGAAARLYAGMDSLTHPLISPVYGGFDGFPPTILTSGTRDLFLSDVVRVHRKMRAAGVVADLHVYEAMSHAGYIVSPQTPESKDMYREVGAFFRRYRVGAD